MWAWGHLFYILLCALKYLNRLHKHIAEPMEDTDRNPPARDTRGDKQEFQDVITYIQKLSKYAVAEEVKKL